jgi:hypothetical protein
VGDKYQKVDDAEIGIAIVNHLILLQNRPYKENASLLHFNEKTPRRCAWIRSANPVFSCRRSTA